jgi:hypothetical protein
MNEHPRTRVLLVLDAPTGLAADCTNPVDLADLLIRRVVTICGTYDPADDVPGVQLSAFALLERIQEDELEIERLGNALFEVTARLDALGQQDARHEAQLSAGRRPRPATLAERYMGMMSARPDALSADRQARRVAPGHVRLDRPVIVPNAPTPPDPLDNLVWDIFPDCSAVRVFTAFRDAFGCVLTYERIAILHFGDSAEVRQSARVQRWRASNLGALVCRLNERLRRYRQPYHIENVRRVGYRLVDGPYQPQPAIRYTAEQKVTLLAQYHTLRETHPNLTYKQRCRKIGVAHQTVADWLKAARRAEAS